MPSALPISSRPSGRYDNLWNFILACHVGLAHPQAELSLLGILGEEPEHAPLHCVAFQVRSRKAYDLARSFTFEYESNDGQLKRPAAADLPVGMLVVAISSSRSSEISEETESVA